MAEGWRKRRYKAAFIAKLSDAEGEACEAQVWIDFARRCGYLAGDIADKLDAKYGRMPAGTQARPQAGDIADKLDAKYEQIMSQLVKMIDEADKWLIK
ncbi:MAG: four helix bundle protein [Desulfobacterales bacterium]|nr:four helix bundle protein [Desulfobacterales bacterium]